MVSLGYVESFGCVLKSGIAGLYSEKHTRCSLSSMFQQFISHQWWVPVLLLHGPGNITCFLDDTIGVVRQNPKVVLVFSSIVANDIKHFKNIY